VDPDPEADDPPKKPPLWAVPVPVPEAKPPLWALDEEKPEAEVPPNKPTLPVPPALAFPPEKKNHNYRDCTKKWSTKYKSYLQKRAVGRIEDGRE